MFTALVIVALFLLCCLVILLYFLAAGGDGIYAPDLDDIPTPEEIRMATIERVVKLSERRE